MRKKNPRLTIGLPVYNGEKFIGEALDSLLAQTFSDFEIIIADNASTDRTADICRAYAEKDERITVYRHAQNLGATKNFNLVVSLAQGEYFKWSACDDICAPTFIEKCVAVLDRDPSVVLAHSRVRVIDSQGNYLRKGLDEKDQRYVVLTNRNVPLKSNSSKAHERFRDLACFPHSCYQMFGVMRLDVLKQTPLIRPYRSSDKVLLARLGLIGRYHEVPEELFFLRRHEEQSMSVAPSTHLYSVWLDPSLKGKLIFPRCRIFYEYFKAIQETPLPWRDKIACYAQLLPLLRVDGLGMLKDIVIAVILIADRGYRKLCFKMLNLKASPVSENIFGKFPRLN